MTTDRPKAYIELIARLDAAGWSYGVRWTQPDKNLTKLTVTGVPPWDEEVTRIEAEWLSRDGGALKAHACRIREPYHGFHDLSLRAVHLKITPEGPS